MRLPDEPPIDDLDPKFLEGIETNRWRVLYRVSGLLNSRSVDLDRTLATILSVVLAASRGERALLLLKNDDGQLELAARRGAFLDDPREDRVSWTIVQRVFESGQGVYIPEVEDDDELATAESIEALSIRSALCVPLKTGIFEGSQVADERRSHPPYLGQYRDVLGVLYVDSTKTSAPYDRDDLGLLQALANIATTAITNARLHAEASRDAATGLFTRRYFEIALQKVNRLARRHQFPYGVLLLDLEDTEETVEAAGRRLLPVLRTSDIPARYGASALAAILPYAALDETLMVAGKVAAALGDVRIGASAVPAPAADASQVVTQADRARVAARGASPGAVVGWTPEIGLEGPLADRLAGLLTGQEGEDHRRIEALVDENARLREKLAAHVSILGESKSLVGALERARKVAPTGAPVLILGESGTGKELFARAIHAMSPRETGPLVVVDCGAIPDNLLESELFGHEAGSFTGAAGRHIGKFERADGGTIFLDEVGELPLALQTKFLRALQEHSIERVGGTERIDVDVRIVAATNKDLEGAVESGAFRQDLFYRLNVVRVDLPPLRQRGRDVLVLARHFLERFAREFQKPLSGFDDDATDALLTYEWPGNIRELENRIQQAAILAEDNRISAADLALPGYEPTAPETYKDSRRRAIDAFETDYITKALVRHEGDVAACAQEMGLSERRFRELRQKLGIRREDFE